MKSKLRKLFDLAIKHSSKFSIFGYIAGLIWLAALAHPSVSNSTYFSENALLPGLVVTEYNARQATKGLREDVENPSVAYREDFPSWLIDRMTAIGLEAYKQNFSIMLPEEISDKGSIIGTNVYGILRAPRTAGIEALVFTVPLKEENSGPFYELVLLLSLAQHFRNNVYWSKDIIFLVADQKEFGTKAWLDEYHGIISDYIKSSQMLGRSGAIQAAINLDLEDKDISNVEVMVEGLNGQLPNLDLVNMVIRLCESEHIPVSLKKQNFYHANDGWGAYWSALSTMTTMMFSQATGRPSSIHGLFPKYGVEAVTLRGIKASGGKSVGFGRIGRALEGMFRSLNNLLERFHQSFFFYLLSSTHRYVSIGLYMPPLGCLMVGPIFLAVACWMWSAAANHPWTSSESTKSGELNQQQESGDLNVSGNEENKRNEIDEKENEKSGKESEEKEQSAVELQEEEVAFSRIPRHFGKVLRVFLAGHLAGLFVYVSPQVSRYIRPTPFNLEPSTFSVLALMTSFSCSSLVLPFLLSVSTSFTTRDVILLKCLALVVYSCAVGCLATVNFSFGCFLAVFTVPSFLFVWSTQNKIRRVIQVVLVFISSPPSVLFLLTLIYTCLTSPNPTSYERFFSDSFTLLIDCIVASLRDSLLLRAWSFPVTTLILTPSWLLFWTIAWT